MATVKLRDFPNIQELPPEIQEIIRYNYWVIENALNSVGAVGPNQPGTGSDPVDPAFVLLDYFKLSGRLSGQIGYGATGLFGSGSGTDPALSLKANSTSVSYINLIHDNFFDILDLKGKDYLFLKTGRLELANVANNFNALEITVPTSSPAAPSGFGAFGTFYGSLQIVPSPQTGSSSSLPVGLMIDNLGRRRINLWIERGPSQTEDLVRFMNEDSSTILSRIDSNGVWVGSVSVSGTSFATFADNIFRLADNGDLTKLLAFELSGISPTGTTRTWTVQNASGTIPLLSGINQTWGSLQKFPDNVFQIVGSADATKIAVFEVDGFTTATTRTFTLPNATGTIPILSGVNQTWGSVQTFPDNVFKLVDDGDATKGLILQLSGITTGNTWTWTVQDVSGTVALLNGGITQTWTSQNIFINDISFQNNVNFTSGIIDIDTTTGSQLTIKTPNGGGDTLLYWYDGSGNDITFTVAGLYGSVSLAIPNTGGTLVTSSASQALTAKSINGGSTTQTGKTANISGTITVSPTTAANYIAVVVLEVTTAGGADRTISVDIGYTDDVGAVTDNSIVTFAANATGRKNVLVPFRRASGNVTYATTLAGAAGSAPTYSLYVRLLNTG